MQENFQLSLADLDLLNALQIAPRASWSSLSEILEAHPTTLARRWEKLTERGLARIAIAPGRELLREMDVAFVELTCENQAVREVAENLIQDPRLMSIQFIAGSAHLLLTVAAPDHGLASFLLDTLGSMHGIMHYAARTVTSQIHSAASWRFRGLEPQAVHALESLQREITQHSGHVPQMDGINRAILRQLSVDGRSSFREIAQQTRLSPISVRRRIERMIGANTIDVRCDVTRYGAGHSYSAILWGTMSSRDVSSLPADAGRKIPALRVMSLVTGTANIHMVVWLNNPTDLSAVERQLLDAFEGLAIIDRRIVLRSYKYNGARIAADGSVAEVIAMAY